MNKSILVAGAVIAGAILLQPIVARLVEKQTTIRTETGTRQVNSERNAQQENRLHKGFGAEPPRGKGKLYDLNAPNESDRQPQD
jgi:hypothetical protein